MLSNKIIGIILAAGESKRMGSPKAFLEICNKTFLENLVSTLENAGLEKIVVVLGHDSEKIISSHKNLNVDFIINADYIKGQLSSIQTAIKNFPNEVEAILICPVDRPLISSELVRMMVDQFIKLKPPIVLPVNKNRRGHPIIFSSTLFAELLKAPIDVGARAVVWAHLNEVVEVPTDEEGILLNIDTPELYEKYIRNNM